MTLEEFERSLVEDRKSNRHERTSNDHNHDPEHPNHREHHHRRHHRHHRRHSSRSGSRDQDSRLDERPDHPEKYRRHHKRLPRHANEDGHDDDHRHKRRHRQNEEKESNPFKETGTVSAENATPKVKRDAWMETPSALEIDYIQPRDPHLQEQPKPTMLQADLGLKIHHRELNEHLRDLRNGKLSEDPENEPEKHDIDYEFGDLGSQWRMTKLRAVYREAEETNRSVEDVAEERFGDLQAFDDAREEEIELDRRERYGKSYVGKTKPSGELFQERKSKYAIDRKQEASTKSEDDKLHNSHQRTRVTIAPSERISQHLDATSLNRLRAKMMKAKLSGSSDAATLEAEYNAATTLVASRKEPDVVVLGVMESRMLAGDRRGEVKPVENRRGRERGKVEENEDMSIEDMVREERRTRGQGGGEGYRLAERIAKDAKFDNNLDYIDENAAKLAKRVQKSELDLRNTAINEFQKINRILDNCPLCYHEDTNSPPVAPVISLATRIYLTLPTEPELAEGSATIVPIQHHTNLIECDDDEWEEIRNFMKSLTRLYHDQGRDVIFYENAAHPDRKRHACLEVVPLPYSLGETSPAFFKEAILAADSEWTQHRKLIDTLAKARQGMGKSAFRRTIAKEMPYFHVWFELDGGLGHVVEDPHRWPRGDLFAREILGGMMDLAPDVIKRQGKWTKGSDRRVDGFKKRWKKFDWTRILTEG